MNPLDELKSRMETLAESGKSLKSLNFVRINDPSSILPTEGSCTIKAGTIPEVVSQAGVNPWLRYPTNTTTKISRTALLSSNHFSPVDGRGLSFRDLKSRTTYDGLTIDEAWTFSTIEVNGEDFTIAIPARDLKVTFKDGGTVFVPAKTDGSNIVSFKKKEKYALLTIS